MRHIFFAEHRGNGTPHGERALSPERAKDSSPGQASCASAALGQKNVPDSPLSPANHA